MHKSVRSGKFRHPSLPRKTFLGLSRQPLSSPKSFQAPGTLSWDRAPGKTELCAGVLADLTPAATRGVSADTPWPGQLHRSSPLFRLLDSSKQQATRQTSDWLVWEQYLCKGSLTAGTTCLFIPQGYITRCYTGVAVRKRF